MNNLADHEFTNFQHLPPWRTLVPVVADEVARVTGQGLVAVQTVLHELLVRAQGGTEGKGT